MATDLVKQVRTVHGHVRFVVETRRVDGRRLRRYFAVYADAVDWAETRLKDRAQYGNFIGDMTPGQQLLVNQAAERLHHFCPDLEIWDAVDIAIKVRCQTGAPAGPKPAKIAPVTVEQAVAECLESKRLAGLAQRSLQQLRSTWGQFARGREKTRLDAVSTREIEQWLADGRTKDGTPWQSPTRKCYLVDLRTLFGWAKDRGLCQSNPAAVIQKPRQDGKLPGIWTVDQVEQMLKLVRKHDKGLLPYFVIGLFAGLRTCELEQITWDQVHEDCIEVLKGKKRQRRIVTINETLAAWLKLKGELPAVNHKRRLDDLKKIAKAAGLPWPHNVIRHSFASYYLQQHRSADKTAMELGHRSTQMLYDHYRELVRPEAAARFWALRP